MSKCSTGSIHNKDVSGVRSLKTKRNLGPDKWHLLQQMNSWNTFNSHTLYLEDAAMQERILAIIRCMPDPFAAEIRYHRSCWKKYINAIHSWESNGSSFHLQDVHLSEV